jgi:hypothetical protein
LGGKTNEVAFLPRIRGGYNRGLSDYLYCMGAFMVRIIGRIIWGTIIGAYAAFLRWLCNFGRKPYGYYYKNEDGVTYAYAYIGTAVTVVLIIYIHYRISN